MANFRIGTRGSLLATAQSSIVKLQLEKLYPEHHFELIKIKTLGDQQVDKPLWQMDGKNFFTKELDDALIACDVDLVVHSHKDLAGERPPEIITAAIPPRTFAHDVLLIHQNTLEKMQQRQLKKICIGTSSPRRQELMTAAIAHYLPYGEMLEISFQVLRGNINTRLMKLQEKQYDLICLAAAGLERLTQWPDSQPELQKLLQNLHLKFLPLSQFPCAPAQGALAIECLKNHPAEKLLRPLNDQNTQQNVETERKIFQQFGGGCHLAVGIHSQTLQDKGSLTIVRGKHEDKMIEEKILMGKRLLQEKIAPQRNAVFIGISPERKKQLQLGNQFIADELRQLKPVTTAAPREPQAAFCYLTSEHTLSHYQKNSHPKDLLWVAGTTLHQTLAKLGHWVTGDNDSLGDLGVKNFLQSGLGQLLTQDRKKFQLSYVGQTSNDFINWGSYQVHLLEPSSNFNAAFNDCRYYFWTSARQFDHYYSLFPHLLQEQYRHYCGMGKTWERLRTKIKNISAVPHLNDFLNFFNP